MYFEFEQEAVVIICITLVMLSFIKNVWRNRGK